ncbi:MAG: DUF2933 domain-containing protein [Hyphomicrobium sp.]|uniref:DUF2933 domain-containing protein n=1 Tax=Hyphomicrobium sp. TaxID=82 RepID=UPI00132A3956|nr:DUF2933 domain-containing protein [Hyphomicrobium sp.]KAB2943542.1 MAG: DUF2933 domain-containing protein [Hyphomicrobium sp.]MBZ0209743.1 DUF2933 domain-containing protein [Hyphomicrobium sp.]
MTDHEHAEHDRRPSSEGSFWGSRTFIVWLALLLIGGFLLVSEHRAHILGVGLWLLILACPLLHIFGHGGHGGHGEQASPRAGPDTRGSTGSWDASKGEKS